MIKSFKAFIKEVPKKLPVPAIFAYMGIHARHDPFAPDEKKEQDTKKKLKEDWYDIAPDYEKYKKNKKPLKVSSIPFKVEKKENEDIVNTGNELTQLHHYDNPEKLKKFANSHAIFNYTTSGSKDVNKALIHMHQHGMNPLDMQHHLDYFTDVRKKIMKQDGDPLVILHGEDGALAKYKKRIHSEASTTFRTVRTLSNMIKKAPKLHRDINVYTGVGASFDIQKHREAGNDKIHLPAFTSTSLDPKIAHDFSTKFDSDYREIKDMPEMVRIKLPAGSKHGMYIGPAGISGEREYLLHHGKTLKFKGAPRVIHWGTFGGEPKHVLIHDAEIADD